MVSISLDEELTALLRETNRPIEDSARELIVLELYRRAAISDGKAAELLDMPRLDFIRHASRLGIPVLDLTEDEWQSDRGRAELL